MLQGHRPLPLSDVPLTLADIRLSRQVLGYSPTVSIEEGVKRFTEWLLWYRMKKKEEVGKDGTLK